MSGASPRRLSPLLVSPRTPGGSSSSSSVSAVAPVPRVLATSLEEQLSRLGLGQPEGKEEAEGEGEGDEEEELDEAALEEALKAALAPRPQVLTVSIIKQRCLPKALLESGDEEKIASAAFRLTHLYLDGLGICEMDGLELFNETTHLYLQRNLITEIKGLEFLPKLKFLCLMENKISKVSGLRHLRRLDFLDLSKNDIDTLDPESLPPNVRVLRLAGNPCCGPSGALTGSESVSGSGGRLLRDLVATLPALEQIDALIITPKLRTRLCDEYEAALADPLRFACDFCRKGPLRLERNDHFHCYTCRTIDLCAGCHGAAAEGKGHVRTHDVRPYDAELVQQQQAEDEDEGDDSDPEFGEEDSPSDEGAGAVAAAADRAAASMLSSSRAAVQRSKERQKQKEGPSDSAVLAMLHQRLSALQAEKQKQKGGAPTEPS